LDETELVQRALQGDLAAWEPLVLANQEPVFRLAYLFLKDAGDAEDVAQETFLRAYRQLQRFDRSRPLRPWLLGIASNLARNRMRAAGRYLAALLRAYRAAPPQPLNIEERSSVHLRAQTLWKAVQQLEISDQQVIYLRFFLDLSVSEAAEAMLVAEGTVKSRLSRALGRLRTIIEREFPALREGMTEW
jgi:RNA polymerase sigma-70 factor (ECF subfamily)